MATVTKDDPNCPSDIVFIGNIDLRPYTEHPNTTLPPPHATARMNIDVLASGHYEHVGFKDVMVFLEIKGPSGVRFVEGADRDNWLWGIPDGGGWTEIPTGTPTTLLRMRKPDAVSLIRPKPIDGLTYYVGLSGLPPGGGVDLKVSATASRVLATAQSCSIEVTDLRVGDELRGYLSGNPSDTG
ncbi:hypothetical protein ACGFRB_26925 [Streptomyces sp. NPDC048718]|uniref:hypothetical protein n=1 Tax=Streptomyces sp. NPDC048718 TaxID=3365587 RepID=UPI0037151855